MASEDKSIVYASIVTAIAAFIAAGASIVAVYEQHDDAKVPLRHRSERSRQSAARACASTPVWGQRGHCAGRSGTELERDVILQHGTQAHH